MKEMWKDIKDYEGLYQVSNLGRVKNRYNNILKPEYSNKGYACVQLRKNNKCRKHRVHRLVANAFIPNPENKPEVNHIDMNKSNNTISNLEWVTHDENSKHYLENADDLGEKQVYCVDLDEVFASTSDASRKTGVNRTSIVKACRNQLKSAGGMLWRYK